jgi:hypothetical protein
MWMVEGILEVLGAVTKENFSVFYRLSLVFYAFFPIGCLYVTSNWSSR